MKYMDYAGAVGQLLVLVGALNWGIMGVDMLMGGSGYNLVEAIFGTGMLTAVIYTLVGVSAVPAAWGYVKGLMGME